jgi:hypothetical protein
MPTSPYTTDNLVASYSYHDAEGDIQSGSEIRWYKNGVPQSAYNNLKTVPSSATTKGDTWYFTVKPKDGFDFGTLQTSPSVTIQNSPPSASNLSISPSSPKSTDNLVGSYSYSDADGDPESGSEIRWYKSGTLQTAYNDLKTIPSSALSDGQMWYFTVKPKDGQTFGVLNQSPSVTVGAVNNAPVASNLNISPSKPHTTDTLTASYSYYDANGDKESGTEIQWYRNSVLQPAYDNQPVIPTGVPSAGDTWYFTVRPRDGKDFGALQTSSAVTILAAERDVAVTRVSPYKTVAGRGHPMYINVTVENQGSSTETFNVTAYANTTTILTTTITLDAHMTKTIVVEWNTTRLAIGNYTVAANVPVLHGETDVGDNTCTFWSVFVGLPGDLNCDGKVNIVDVALAAVAYSSKLGDQKWNANADINCDQVINIIDMANVAKEYGKSL